jgi:hypothetical protein
LLGSSTIGMRRSRPILISLEFLFGLRPLVGQELDNWGLQYLTVPAGPPAGENSAAGTVFADAFNMHLYPMYQGTGADYRSNEWRLICSRVGGRLRLDLCSRIRGIHPASCSELHARHHRVWISCNWWYSGWRHNGRSDAGQEHTERTHECLG